MNKNVYGFRIMYQEDSAPERYKFMLYTIKDNLLEPAITNFALGHEEFFDFKTMITTLRKNKIKSLITYPPKSDTVLVHPYELNTEAEREIAEFEGYDKFIHLEINLDKELKDEKISLIHLSNKEISKLEKGLKFQVY